MPSRNRQSQVRIGLIPLEVVLLLNQTDGSIRAIWAGAADHRGFAPQRHGFGLLSGLALRCPIRCAEPGWLASRVLNNRR
jgi:hypothetical protein